MKKTIIAAAFVLTSVVFAATSQQTTTKPATTQTKPIAATQTKKSVEEVKSSATQTGRQTTEQVKSTTTQTKKSVEEVKSSVAQTKPTTTASGERDGATLYKLCVACHGQKAEKPYPPKKGVPLTTLSKEEIATALKEYKAGTKNLFGMGGIMKNNMANWKMTDGETEAVAAHIKTF
jgi:cytochrome c